MFLGADFAAMAFFAAGAAEAGGSLSAAEVAALTVVVPPQLQSPLGSIQVAHKASPSSVCELLDSDATQLFCAVGPTDTGMSMSAGEGWTTVDIGSDTGTGVGLLGLGVRIEVDDDSDDSSDSSNSSYSSDGEFFCNLSFYLRSSPCQR
jgi:hypothetical protein